MSGTVTAGAKSMELGALNTKSPVGRATGFCPGDVAPSKPAPGRARPG